ncbi:MULTISPECIES: helix-turn-helix domain-containing protein [Paenibacillus]|uniref:DNA-binding protein n=1 Tax=Paenibacillus azoreducens TaxID=116718 RepID=A0A919YK53_9BACL|nr:MULTISPECIES: XRE family transcriptional regulator [Paenibacillus]MBE9913093.1 helix-turn-helix domain-containing protein [Paenibacillus donghaensis]GIO49777.1 DNA-binding protein [Paenibacillus azoreducens]
MDSIHIRIGNNLGRIRKQRNLSLDKMAELTGVSKGMLHQIERGNTQPTVTTLWKIATGLQISFSSLLKDDQASVSISVRKDIPDVTEDDGRCSVYMLFPFDPHTRMELFTIVLNPGGNYISSPHNDGVQEYITVTSGIFKLQVGDEVYNLQEGSAVRFAGNVQHRYMNPSDEDTTIQVIMYYAET